MRFPYAKRCRPRFLPFLELLESRLVPYSVSGASWPHPNLVTLSFVPDGTLLTTNASGNVYSNLFATFNAKFGSTATWQNQILKAAQVWAQQTNLNFAVVSDDGVSAGAGLASQLSQSVVSADPAFAAPVVLPEKALTSEP